MKSLLIVVVMVVGVASPQERKEFLSWYNGWGEQTLWGIGKIQGSYFGTTVKCGDDLVPVRTVYDTHEHDGPPLASASRESVESANRALLKDLEARGIKCAFQLIKQ